ncbi:MAG: ABC transporter substrate-binding protein [Ruminococcus sp.]|jgi:ABC-type nitrate/sulfonate/bicarbonate transport system substrate-binding protein
MKKKTLKKLTGVALSAVMAISMLAGCGSGESDTQEDTSQNTEETSEETADDGELKGSGETLTVGVQPCSFCYPVIYASEQGYFEDAGLDVEYIVFDNGSSMNEGLAAQQLDIGVNGLATIYTVCGGVCDLIGESESCATGAIYARPDSAIAQASEIDGMNGSKETLEGVTILGATSTLTQQQAYAYMNQFGLTAGTDYEFLNMDYSTANQAFIAGEGDLISVDGLNYIAELEDAGMVRVCDYAAATGSPYRSGIVSRRDVSENRADDVTLFLKVFYETADELMNDIDTFEAGYLEYVLENGREYTEETVAEEIAARPLFTKETMEAADYELGVSTISAAEFFADIGVIEEGNLDNLANINPDFLNAALDLNVKAAVRE